MPTSSSIPTIKAALIAALQTRSGLSDVHVVYQWNGAATTDRMMWLDPFDPTGGGPGERQTETIPTNKAGRKARQEDYQIVVAIQVVQPGGTADGAAATEAAGYALLAELDSMLADDPNLAGAAGPTGVVKLADHTRRLFPSDKGWMSRIDATVDVSARLS